MIEFGLTGPRGDNPLGFLTALGALVTLEDAGYRACLGWDTVHPRLLVCIDSLTSTPPKTDEERRQVLVEALHQQLRRARGQETTRTERARKEMEQAKTVLKKKREDIKKRKLDREAVKEARRHELEPLEAAFREKTAAFKKQLIRDAADPSVTLGKNVTAANAELVGHFGTACERCSPAERRWVDLAAAYGLADPARPDERMLASPWVLINGSGHQDFFTSVEELMVQCKAEHLRQALFGAWNPRDEKYSLRLDAADDRRYALMDRDPTASGNKPLTLWGANRLAFEALRYFPATPQHGGMGVRGWHARAGNWQDGCRVRWPLWDDAIPGTVVHSLLGLSDLWLGETASRDRIRELGVHAVMESHRMAVGEGANRKYNMTPATPIWVSIHQS